jgi:cobalt/nickel transport protein
MSTVTSEPWARKALAVVIVLIVLAPAFGLAAGAIGYAEPIDNAAEATGATEHESVLNPGLFPDYTVPGLGGGLGTLLSAVVGTGLTLAVAVGVGRLLEE